MGKPKKISSVLETTLSQVGQAGERAKKLKHEAKIAKAKEAGKDCDYNKFYHVIVDLGILAFLTPEAVKVYMVLLRHCNDVTRRCWPNRDTISKEAGLHCQTVTKAIKKLESAGLIKKWKRGWKSFYYLYRKEEIRFCSHIRPLQTDIYKKDNHIEPSSTVIYGRDKKGKFATKQESPDKKTSAIAVPNGLAIAVPNGHKEESLRKEKIKAKEYINNDNLDISKNEKEINGFIKSLKEGKADKKKIKHELQKLLDKKRDIPDNIIKEYDLKKVR